MQIDTTSDCIRTKRWEGKMQVGEGRGGGLSRQKSLVYCPDVRLLAPETPPGFLFLFHVKGERETFAS